MEYAKKSFGGRAPPGPSDGAHSSLPDPLAVLGEGRGGKRDGSRKGGNGKGRKKRRSEKRTRLERKGEKKNEKRGRKGKREEKFGKGREKKNWYRIKRGGDGKGE